jgi:hypothetical protein
LYFLVSWGNAAGGHITKKKTISSEQGTLVPEKNDFMEPYLIQIKIHH